MDKTKIDEKARGNIIASFVTNIMSSIDFIIFDDENIKFLEKGIKNTNEKISDAYSFPLSDYSKVDDLKAKNDVIKEILNLCKCRKKFIKDCKERQSNSKSHFDEKFLDLLGF